MLEGIAIPKKIEKYIVTILVQGGAPPDITGFIPPGVMTDKVYEICIIYPGEIRVRNQLSKPTGAFYFVVDISMVTGVYKQTSLGTIL